MRHVICHYHIYKNSGTTFDALLTSNFSEAHICFDGPFPFFTIDQEQLSRIIERKRDIVAFSSHQIQLPVPSSLDFNVLPVVFVRHPLLRTHSIYRFKRRDYDGTTTSQAAQRLDFEEWIQHCLNDRQEITQISNAQTRMLGTAYGQRPQMKRTESGMQYDLMQALRNLSTVELLGRTEQFSEDVASFTKVLANYDIEFKFEDIGAQNSTTNDQHLAISDRVRNLKEILTNDTFKRLSDVNSQDLELYHNVNQRLS